jgi:hypothetical protein
MGWAEVSAILISLGAMGASIWLWFKAQRKEFRAEITAEEQEARRLKREEEDRQLLQRAMPLTQVLEGLRADYQKVKEGDERKTEALTQALVRIATSETRLANMEARAATAEARCNALEQDNAAIRREHSECRETQMRQAQQLSEQSQEIQALRRRLGETERTPNA